MVDQIIAGFSGPRAALVAAILLVALTGVACSGDNSPAPAAPPAAGAAAPAEPPAGGRTLPIPGGATDPHQKPRAGQGGGRMTWPLPEGWIEETPANSVRLAQYRVPGPAGDGECVVFYFGPGQGGDPMANATRWAGQFVQPDGRPSAEVMKVEELESATVPTLIVEVTGHYTGGMSASDEQEGAMLLGGITQGADAPWFFKFTGPQETVESQRSAFLTMMESVRPEQ